MKKLSWTKRVAIEEGIKAGKSNAQIAREIGVHRATIGREIARNASGRENYNARTADDSSWQRQQEAMPKRFMVRFNGVEWLSVLNNREQIYTYVSRTHLCQSLTLSSGFHVDWDFTYIRPGIKEQFMPDQVYERFRLCDSTFIFPGQLSSFSLSDSYKGLRNAQASLWPIDKQYKSEPFVLPYAKWDHTERNCNSLQEKKDHTDAVDLEKAIRLSNKEILPQAVVPECNVLPVLYAAKDGQNVSEKPGDVPNRKYTIEDNRPNHKIVSFAPNESPQLTENQKQFSV